MGWAPIRPTDLIFNSAGTKRAKISKNLEQAPEIIPLVDEEDVAERGSTSKAARYVRETNQLFVNLKANGSFKHGGWRKEAVEVRREAAAILKAVREAANC